MGEVRSSELVEQLQQAARHHPDHVSFVEGQVGLMFLALASVVAAAGECRVTTPYAGLRPILEDEGLRWVCTHQEGEHRSQLVAGREA